MKAHSNSEGFSAAVFCESPNVAGSQQATFRKIGSNNKECWAYHFAPATRELAYGRNRKEFLDFNYLNTHLMAK